MPTSLLPWGPAGMSGEGVQAGVVGGAPVGSTPPAVYLRDSRMKQSSF